MSGVLEDKEEKKNSWFDADFILPTLGDAALLLRWPAAISTLDRYA